MEILTIKIWLKFFIFVQRNIGESFYKNKKCRFRRKSTLFISRFFESRNKNLKFFKIFFLIEFQDKQFDVIF